MKFSKIFISFIFGMVVITSIVFILVQKIEREIIELKDQDKKQEIVDKKLRESGTSIGSNHSIILSQELVLGYGESIESPEDDDIILAIVKKDFRSLEEEVIYRIKKKRIPKATIELIDRGIFIQRNLFPNDNVLIDFSGNELPISEFDLSSGIYSNNQKFFVYLEKSVDWKLNLVNLEKQEIVVLPLEYSGDELPKLRGFVPSDEAFLIEYQENKEPKFYFYNLEKGQMIPILDEIIQIFIGEKNIYSTRYAEAESSFYLDKWGSIAQSDYTPATTPILELGQQNLSNLFEGEDKLYLQVDNTIYSFSEGNNTPLISDAKILDVISSDSFLYQKYSELNRVLGVFVFDIKTQSSKEIYQNKLTEYGNPDYKESNFLGIK